MPTRIRLGKRAQTNVTTKCSEDLYPKANPSMTIRQRKFCFSLILSTVCQEKFWAIRHLNSFLNNSLTRYILHKTILLYSVVMNYHTFLELKVAFSYCNFRMIIYSKKSGKQQTYFVCCFSFFGHNINWKFSVAYIFTENFCPIIKLTSINFLKLPTYREGKNWCPQEVASRDFVRHNAVQIAL